MIRKFSGAAAAAIFPLGIIVAPVDAAATTRSDATLQCPAASSASIAARLLSELVDDASLPGISFGVGRDGQLFWDQGFGFADIEQKIAASPLTRYRIGSISKPIAAAAIGVLVERGAIDLDAPVQQYAASFPVKGALVTTRQLAGHIAGIRGYQGDEFLSAKRYASIDEAMGVFKDDPLSFEPGTRYDYTTYGWTVVSAAIEGAAKEEFRQFVKKVVLTPLGMRETDAEDNRATTPHRARYYDLQTRGDGSRTLVNSPYVDLSNKWAGGGYLSTMRDLVRFGNAHLAAGFLKPETLAILMTPLLLNNGQPTRFGIGWESEADLHGRPTIGHTGGAVGGSSVLRLWPEAKLAIAASTNRTDDPGIRLLGNALGEIFHPDRPVQAATERLQGGRYAITVQAKGEEPAIEGELILRSNCAGYEGDLRYAKGTKLGRVAWGQDEKQSTHLFASVASGHVQILVANRQAGRSNQRSEWSAQWVSPTGSRTMTLRLVAPFDRRADNPRP